MLPVAAGRSSYNRCSMTEGLAGSPGAGYVSAGPDGVAGDDATGEASAENLRKCFRRVVVVSPVAPFGATGDAR